MLRRLVMILLLVLWPGLALAQSAAWKDAYKRYKALNSQGRYAEAQPFARKALQLVEKKFGPNHRKTGIYLNNLAKLYVNQGRYAEAEPIHRRALAIKEKALGRGHPSVANSLEGLAILSHAHGR